MNKKNKQLVPLCFAIAIIIFAVILFCFCKPQIERYQYNKTTSDKIQVEKENLEAEVQKSEAAQKEEDLKLQSLKPIFESPLSESNGKIGVELFGNMFEDIIKIAQKNGLLIRKIEYEQNPPQEDPIYNENPDWYNVCELKFFFIGSYGQLQSFFSDINRNISYLTYISNLNITAFAENPDYLLIHISINLYSKKPEQNGPSNRKQRRSK